MELGLEMCIQFRIELVECCVTVNEFTRSPLIWRSPNVSWMGVECHVKDLLGPCCFTLGVLFIMHLEISR
jgi:hypothetical protein